MIGPGVWLFPEAAARQLDGTPPPKTRGPISARQLLRRGSRTALRPSAARCGRCARSAAAVARRRGRCRRCPPPCPGESSSSTVAATNESLTSFIVDDGRLILFFHGGASMLATPVSGTCPRRVHDTSHVGGAFVLTNAETYPMTIGHELVRRTGASFLVEAGE